MRIFGWKKKPGRNKNKKTFKEQSGKKVFILLLIMASLFCILICKLVYIHVFRGEELTRRALNQLTRTETIMADRGIIFDRNGKELAINVAKANVFYNMDVLYSGRMGELRKEDKAKWKKEAKKKKNEVAFEVAKVLEKDKEEILAEMKGKYTVRLASNVTREQALRLREINIYGLIIEDVYRRFYPYNTLAANVLGFTNDELTGVYGIESSYDRELSGIPGKSILYKNIGRKKIPLTDEENYAPKEGFNLVLTIDENIQKIIEEEAEKAKNEYAAEQVNIIVQDTETGEILAMADNGSYNPNNPKAPYNEKQKLEWKNMSNEEISEQWFSNWINSCVSEQYEPGSIFKLITAAAALEEGVTYLDKTYECTGRYNVVPGVSIGCVAPHRGPRTLAQAIEESCNISLVKVGQDLGAEKFYKYMKAFGFGEPTGIDLPAESSGITVKRWEDIGKVKLATMSYGHGIAVTPIQMINAISAIANGGNLNTPRVVDRMEDANGNVIKRSENITKRKVISEETSEKVKYMMGLVVDSGSGKKAKVPGYKIGGKTGTAAIPGRKGYENAYNASFVGIAPLDDPKFTVLVIVNRPENAIYGSAVAAPVAGKVMSRVLEYMKIPKTEKINEKSGELVRVPNIKGLLLEDAGKILVDEELKFNTLNEEVSKNAVVTGQSIKGNSYVEKGTIIDLEICNNDGDVKVMPYLIGKKEKEANSILKELKVEYNINGEGKVIAEKPEAGTKIHEDTVVILNMESTLIEENNENNESNDNNNEVID